MDDMSVQNIQNSFPLKHVLLPLCFLSVQSIFVYSQYVFLAKVSMSYNLH